MCDAGGGLISRRPTRWPTLHDLVLVDGRDRVECTRSALPKLRPDGVLMLDDTDRIAGHDQRYAPVLGLLSHLRRIDFPSDGEKVTSVWRA